jgi:hypothetical protein
MAQCFTITVRVRFAWWFWPYFAVMRAWVLATGRMPSEAHLNAVGRRAIKTSVVEQTES